jgi:hypothetical protein
LPELYRDRIVEGAQRWSAVRALSDHASLLALSPLFKQVGLIVPETVLLTQNLARLAA